MRDHDHDVWNCRFEKIQDSAFTSFEFSSFTFSHDIFCVCLQHDHVRKRTLLKNILHLDPLVGRLYLRTRRSSLCSPQ